MYNYLEILQKKAKKIGADIEVCGHDKECIKNILAKKARTDLEDEELFIILEKASQLNAIIPTNTQDKTLVLDAIEERIKRIIEEENERFTSIELQKNFLAIDIC